MLLLLYRDSNIGTGKCMSASPLPHHYPPFPKSLPTWPAWNTHAPNLPSLRSIVLSLFLVSCSFGSLLGIALSPASKDPKVHVKCASLSAVVLATTTVFLIVFRMHIKIEEKMNMLLSESSELARSDSRTGWKKCVEC